MRSFTLSLIVTLLAPCALWAQGTSELYLSHPIALTKTEEVKKVLVELIEEREHAKVGRRFEVYMPENVFEACEQVDSTLVCEVDYVKDVWNGTLKATFSLEKLGTEWALTNILNTQFEGNF